MFNKFSGKGPQPEPSSDFDANARQSSERNSKTNEKPMGFSGSYPSGKSSGEATNSSANKGMEKTYDKGTEKTYDKGAEKTSGFGVVSSATGRDAKSSKMESSSYDANERQSKSMASDSKSGSASRRRDSDAERRQVSTTMPSAVTASASASESTDVKVIRVVILGAGYAGVTAALTLDQIMSSDSFLSFEGGKSFWSSWFSGSCVSRDNKSVSAPKVKYEVVLISRMDGMHHNVASLRGMVQPAIGEGLFIPLTHVFDGSTKLNEKTHAPSNGSALYEGRFIQGTVSNATESSVTYTTPSGKEEKLGFDFLVIALGSSYAAPMKTEKSTVSEAVSELTDYAAKLKAAKSVLIVGGGPVGVELAGEIAVDNPDKKVTLVHAGESLVEHGGVPKLQSGLLASLKAKGVEVLLGHRVTSNVSTGFGNKTVMTDKGVSIESDAQFRCVGTTLNSSSLRGLTAGAGEGVLDAAGRFKVNSYLQLEGSEHVFAVGDVCNTDETKLGYTAALHGPVAAGNVSKLAKYMAEMYRSSGKATLEETKGPGSRKNTMDTSLDSRSTEGRAAAETEPATLTERSAPVAKPVLTAYKGAPMNIMAVTVGRSGGLTQFSTSLVFGDFVTRMIKAKDLFLSRYWSTLRAGKVPVEL